MSELSDVPEALLHWLREAFADESLQVTCYEKLAGGAIQQNMALALSLDDGRAGRSLVLRTDAPSGVDVSLTRAEEHAVLVAAHEAGVAVPEPVAFCDDTGVLGAPFFLMERVTGTTHPIRLTRDETLDDAARSALLERLGAELARIHAVPLEDPTLAFLVERSTVVPQLVPRPARPDINTDNDTDTDTAPAAAATTAGADGFLGHRIEHYRGLLDALGQTRPVLEWALAWLERRSAATTSTATTFAVLCHNDFRTGNLMIDGECLNGVLDWEFAAVGDRHEDIGWFCAPCWRFARRDRAAGGLGDRDDFYKGYVSASGVEIDAEAVEIWEIVATLRWAIIALQQGARFTSGAEATLELALTGRMVAELEQDILDQVTAFEADSASVAGVAGADTDPAPFPEELLARNVDNPPATGLLEAARALMRDDIVPALSPELRYRGLMIVNALGIAQRELGGGEEGAIAGERAHLEVRQYFRGLADAALSARALRELLRADVERRLSVANPRRLQR